MAISQRTAKKRRGAYIKTRKYAARSWRRCRDTVVLFGLAPMVLALVMAFFKMKKITSFEGAEFVWFENFKYIFTDPNFGTSIVNTLIYVLVLPVSIFLGLLVAAVLNSKVRGKGFSAWSCFSRTSVRPSRSFTSGSGSITIITAYSTCFWADKFRGLSIKICFAYPF